MDGQSTFTEQGVQSFFSGYRIATLGEFDAIRIQTIQINHIESPGRRLESDTIGIEAVFNLINQFP